MVVLGCRFGARPPGVWEMGTLALSGGAILLATALPPRGDTHSKHISPSTPAALPHPCLIQRESLLCHRPGRWPDDRSRRRTLHLQSKAQARERWVLRVDCISMQCGPITPPNSLAVWPRDKVRCCSTKASTSFRILYDRQHSRPSWGTCSPPMWQERILSIRCWCFH